MTWETEPARCAQRGRAGFTRGREIAGVAALFAFSIGTGLGFRSAGPTFFSLERCRSVPAGFAMFPSFPFRTDEYGRVQAFLVVPVHSPSPRSRTTALMLAGRNG